MGEVKLLYWLIALCDLILYSISGILIWANIETWKGHFMFVAVLLMIFTRIYFYIKQKNQALREKEIDIRRKQFELENLENLEDSEKDI